jgi:hypothetical protein
MEIHISEARENASLRNANALINDKKEINTSQKHTKSA